MRAARSSGKVNTVASVLGAALVVDLHHVLVVEGGGASGLPPEAPDEALVFGGTEVAPTFGGFLEGALEVHQRARQLQLDVDDYLSRCDAYSFFQQCNGLIFTGPTGTNVCDVRVAMTQP